MKMVRTYTLAAAFLFPLATFAQSEITPQVPFNENEAKSIMEMGNGSVTGKITVRRIYKPQDGTLVFLYPLTPYIEQYVKLRKKYLKNDNYRVYLDELPGKYRRETSVVKGTYSFDRLKPGKYIITCAVNYSGTITENVPVGQTVYMKGNTVVGYGGIQSAPQTRNFSDSSYETAVFTIKKDGEKKQVNL